MATTVGLEILIMAIISLNCGFKLDGRGRKLPLCLFECDLCKKQRVVTKYSFYKKVGIERCYRCNSKIISEIGKNKVWTVEEKERISKGISGEKNQFWNPDRKEIEMKRKIRNTCYNALGSPIKNPTGVRVIKECFKKHGYSPEELRKHLESAWESWMDWNNYGRNKIDK